MEPTFEEKKERLSAFMGNLTLYGQLKISYEESLSLVIATQGRSEMMDLLIKASAMLDMRYLELQNLHLGLMTEDWRTEDMEIDFDTMQKVIMNHYEHSQKVFNGG